MVDLEVNRRFKKLIEEGFKVSPLEFSKKYLDTKAVKTYNIISGRNGLSNKMLEDILKAYPEISKTWLLTGEGEMFKYKTYEQVEKDTDDNKIKDPGSNFDVAFNKESPPPDQNAIFATLMKLVESNSILIQSNQALVEAQNMLAEAHKILAETNAKLTGQVERMKETGLPGPAVREKKKAG